jgi:hypothetical protein
MALAWCRPCQRICRNSLSLLQRVCACDYLFLLPLLLLLLLLVVRVVMLYVLWLVVLNAAAAARHASSMPLRCIFCMAACMQTLYLRSSHAAACWTCLHVIQLCCLQQCCYVPALHWPGSFPIPDICCYCAEVGFRMPDEAAALLMHRKVCCRFCVWLLLDQVAVYGWEVGVLCLLVRLSCTTGMVCPWPSWMFVHTSKNVIQEGLQGLQVQVNGKLRRQHRSTTSSAQVPGSGQGCNQSAERVNESDINNINQPRLWQCGVYTLAML